MALSKRVAPRPIPTPFRDDGEDWYPGAAFLGSGPDLTGVPAGLDSEGWTAWSNMAAPATFADMPWANFIVCTFEAVFNSGLRPEDGVGLPPAQAILGLLATMPSRLRPETMALYAEAGSWMLDLLYTACAVAAGIARSRVRYVSSGCGPMAKLYGTGLRPHPPALALPAGLWLALLHGHYYIIAMVIRWAMAWAMRGDI